MPSPLDWSKSVLIDHADAIFQGDVVPVSGEWFRRDLTLIAATRVRASRFRVDFPPEPPSMSWRIALLVQLEDTCGIENEGPPISLRAGEWRWIDPRHACSIHSDQLAQVIVEMPRRLFPDERSIQALLSHRAPLPTMAAAVVAAASALSDCVIAGDDQTCLVLAESLARMAASSGSVSAMAAIPHDAVAILHRALAWIDARFADPTLSADSLARGIGIPRRTLDKHFSWRRQTADDAIRAIRVQHAARMLAAREPVFRTAAEVAAACGFSDQSSLTRSFRRHFGMTPTAFRHKHGTDRHQRSAQRIRR